LIRQISTSGVDISALEDDVTALQDESELVLTRRSDINTLTRRIEALEEQIGAAR
jgi:polyhydroxyalkanoate synthesis regulator phasin